MRLFLPFTGIKNQVLRIKEIFQSFALNTSPLIHIPKQNGSVFIPVLLLIVGITAAVYLTQTGTSFLPQAQNNQATIVCDICATTGDPAQCRAAFSHCDYTNPDELNQRKSDNNFERCKSYVTTVTTFFCKASSIESPIRKVLASHPLEIDGLRKLQASDYANPSKISIQEPVPANTPGCKCGQNQLCRYSNHSDPRANPFYCIQSDITGANLEETIRKVDNRYCNNLCSGSSSCFLSYYSPEVTLISGKKQSRDSRFLYLFACSTKLKDQDPELAPQAAAPAAAPAAAGQANGISSTACSAQQKQLCDTEPWQPKGGCVITTTGLRQCKYEASREGDRCNNDPAHPETGAACGSKECRIIDGLPRCITNTCTQGEITGCEAKGATCEIGTKKIDGVDKSYTYCKPGTAPAAPRPAAGAPAAPQSNTGQRPQSAQAPSTTKTPWDKDADGDSKLISQVFALAAKDLSKSYDNAKDGIDAAKKARTAYENQFKKAYSDTFKADISKDADALAVLSRELDNVAVHAYISKEHPGMSWETAKSTGKVEAAISNLKRPEVGVISRNSQITASDVSTPGSAPSASAPRRLTIDPTVAVNCGTDLDGTQIPCYQIGVFANYDDLKATEAQATIASKRYELSQKILDEAKERVKNDALIAAAQAKLDAAKAKAAACMPK